MIRKKLYEGKLYEEQTIGSPAFKRVREILIGSFCFGDDGENAEIIDCWASNNDIMITILQDDGIQYDLDLRGYLDAIELDNDDREYIEDFLDSINESAKPAVKRKLVLNEGVNEMKMSVDITREDADTVFNFINYSRELIKEVGLQPIDPKAERIYLQDDILYYQISYMQIRPAFVRKLQTRFNKYRNNSNFPTGMSVDAERGVFTAPLKISGEIKVNAAAFAKLHGIK